MNIAQISVVRVIKMAIVGSFLLIIGMIGLSNMAHAQQYNPCDNIYTQVGIDTAAGAIAGALINSTNRGQGASIGAGAGLGASYAMRQAQCAQYQQQEYYRQEALRQQAAAMAQQNAPRCQYYEQNGVQYRSCTETVQGEWRR